MCIVKNIIEKRGLSITDSEFKCKGLIFFGCNTLNYRKEVFIYNKESNKKIYLSSELTKLITNFAIDYIIYNRKTNHIDNFMANLDVKSIERDIKIEELIYGNNRESRVKQKN